MANNLPTFRQYVADVQRSKRSEYGISVAESVEFYPPSCLLAEWWSTVTTHADAHGTIPASVGRTLTPVQQRDLAKWTGVYVAHYAEGRR